MVCEMLSKKARTRKGSAAYSWYYGFIFSFVVSFFTLFVYPVLAQNNCLECHGDPEFSIENDAGEEIPLFVDSTTFAQSVHGDFQCVDCHADAETISHPDEPLKKVDCSECHDDESATYNGSVHGKAKLAGNTDAPSCSDCHGTHDILSSSNLNSKVYILNVAATCASCHANPKIVKKYNLPEDPLKAYKNSIHGVAVLSEHNFKAATCISCHGAHGIKSMDNPESPIFWKNVPKTCGECHDDIYQAYTESIHGTAVADGVRDAPVCTDCHGEHEVKSVENPESPVNPLKVSSETCERCHASKVLTQRYGLSTSNAATYNKSYHGLAVKEGQLSAANCASCHGIHNILPSSDPRSTIYPGNLRKTCGKCHSDVSANILKGAVHLTTSTTPGRVVKLVSNLYFWLIIMVIGGMILHNGADFVRKSRKILNQRDEE